MIWNEEQVKILKELYGKKSVNELSILVGHTYNSTKKKISELKLPNDKIKRNQMMILGTKKYSVNENFFTKHPHRHYWAGFLAADGNICKRINRSLSIKLEISNKDSKHLQLFKKDIQYSGPILKSVKDCCVIIISSNKLCNDLKQYYNIIPNKTHILKPPNLQNLNQQLQFIKGYIDGDGCISQRNRNNYLNITTIHICAATNEVLLWIKDIFDFLKPSKIRNANVTHQNILYYQYSISGQRALYIGKKIKNSIEIGLDRKWDKINESCC